MTIKNILVAYNGGAASNAAVSLALQMAAKYDAHLTGIAAHGASSVTRNIPNWISESMRETIGSATRQRQTEVERMFKTFTSGKIDPARLHWLDVKANPDKAVAQYARLFDITVLGQYENLIAADELVLHPDVITYETGRPIILAPKSYQATIISERAVVAWDGRRTGSRAFFDAMHVLETKEKVFVVTVGAPSTMSTPKGIDLVTILARHDIEAEHVIIPKSGSIAETLLAYSKSVEAGLLVMGAYQHSKLSEDIFGGVTTEMISKTHLPLFLSH